MCLSVIIISSNTLGAIFMKIKELQKLDLVLNLAHSNNYMSKHIISFGLNGSSYSGDFLPNFTKVEEGRQEHVINLVRGYNTTKEVSLMELSNWSDICKLLKNKFNTNSSYNSFEYLQLIDILINEYSFDFTHELPTYIYNVKNLNTDSPINFMKVDKDTEFDFVSLIPENAT